MILVKPYFLAVASILSLVCPINTRSLTRSLNALTYKSNYEPLSYPPPIKTVGLVIASIALTAASGLVPLESL